MVYTQFYLSTGEIQRRMTKKICLEKMVITLFSSWLCYNTVLFLQSFTATVAGVSRLYRRHKNLKLIKSIMPSNRVEKQKTCFFVFAKFVRKMQFFFTLTTDGFDPDLTSM